ncbi:PIN domain-containing protein [Aquidulcibacter sp.]|jgi:predicted nucleic acid-binding protein|uniref:type II toxin-antitoxin system VapC family toxin n=1 Tax=Aquidulcibacter sp. TaxID=2052990 RepID=UPI0025C31CC8|nr:PIN domain-containing protein [Aquidulcibacter sp.]MCA3696948.1 PIN domain-containing protein [Aquidulcibacter sp.]
MGLIYLDSCICVYAIESASRFHGNVIKALASQPEAQFAVSHLVMAECLVGPLKSGNSFVVQDYEALFKRVAILELNEAVFRQAAHIRSHGNLKMPDALHLACAQFHGCSALWTNDERLAEASGGLAESIVGVQAKR